MTVRRAAIGVGANLGDAENNVRRALAELVSVGDVAAVSSLYRTTPWGVTGQPDYVNAVALLDTDLVAEDLLRSLKAIETRLGRTPAERWAARVIDLDILIYGNETVERPELRVPHPRMLERAFVLVPLAEVDPAYVAARDALPAAERTSVRLLQGRRPRGAESSSLMSDVQSETVGPSLRIRRLAELLAQTDLLRIRIDRDGDFVEVGRPFVPSLVSAQGETAIIEEAPAPRHVDTIKADLVGIFRLNRPSASEGDDVVGDRELAFVEALGIRNPVRSLGAGRIVSVRCRDGQPVEYGQPLFDIDRG